MAHVLKLEAIGGDVTCGLQDKILKMLGGTLPRRYWVAEITGLSTQYGFERVFVKGRSDYTHANSAATRGVYRFYILKPGRIYEISAPLSWKMLDRYFARVEGTALIRMEREEVLTWLNAR